MTFVEGKRELGSGERGRQRDRERERGAGRKNNLEEEAKIREK